LLAFIFIVFAWITRLCFHFQIFHYIRLESKREVATMVALGDFLERALVASSLFWTKPKRNVRQSGNTTSDQGRSTLIGRQPINYWNEFGPSWVASLLDQFKEHGVTLKHTAKSTFRSFPGHVCGNLQRAHDQIMCSNLWDQVEPFTYRPQTLDYQSSLPDCLSYCQWHGIFCSSRF